MAPTEVLASSARPTSWANGLPRCTFSTRPCSPAPHRGRAARNCCRIWPNASVEAAGRHTPAEDPCVRPGLAWVVVDEQHRFRRAPAATACLARDSKPHLLTMTGPPPIPRHPGPSRGMADLEVSQIDELPRSHAGVYPTAAGIKRQQALPADSPAGGPGLQGYVVLPLVEDRKPDLTLQRWEVHNQLSGEVLRRPCVSACCMAAWLTATTSRRRSRLRWRRHRCFARVTTVVEVGVDVPEASVMLIEHCRTLRPGPAGTACAAGGPGAAVVPTAVLINDSRNPLGPPALGCCDAPADGFEIAGVWTGLRGHWSGASATPVGLPDRPGQPQR